MGRGEQSAVSSQQSWRLTTADGEQSAVSSQQPWRLTTADGEQSAVRSQQSCRLTTADCSSSVGRVGWTVCVAVALLCLASLRAADGLDVRALATDIDQFLLREVTTHFAAIPTLDPLPDRVLAAKTIGEFSWGTFMRALAAESQHAGAARLADRDVAQWIGRMGLIEARAGSKAFSQLYAALALQHFAEDLDRNAVWQQLSPAERDEWRSLLDVKRFYDPVRRQVIDLPENYLGVAARVGAIGFRVGLTHDRAPLDALIDRAAEPFAQGRLYSDDSPPTGRFDRYSNEYARYVWDAASQADRQDILARLGPSLTAQMRLWWDLVDGDDGYGYPWGRSLGIVSYLDTLEIVAFVAKHPEFRPAPLADLVSLYARAWNYLRHDFKDQTHLLSLFDYGRGNYSYINLDREWQQTTGFFGKAIVAEGTLMSVLERERLATYPERPALPPVRRFEFFRRQGDRVAGVWVVRQSPTIRFALPITTGTRPGVADYLPAPHGLPGFSVPVERDVPALVPFLELADGRTIVAGDGADEIDASPDARELRVVWRRWAQLGTKSGQLVDPGLTSEVRWTLTDSALERRETLTASAPITIRSWRVIVPTTNTTTLVTGEGALLSGGSAPLRVPVTPPWPQVIGRVQATGNSPLGRGARGAVPIHLVYEARDVRIAPGQPITWQLTLRPGT
jgi:hypothetical protein